MNKKIALFAAIATMAMPIVPAFAQEGTTQATATTTRTEMRQENQVDRAQFKQGMQAKKLEFQNKKEKMVEDKCKNIETKIASRVKRYENNGKMLETVYGNMQTRLERLVTRLKEAGAITTQLETDIIALNEKIDKLKADQATFMTTLADSQSFVCGKSEGEFKGKIDQARKIPAQLKADRDDIKKFFQTTIKADLQAIRKTLAESKTTEKPEATAKTTPAATPTL